MNSKLDKHELILQVVDIGKMNRNDLIVE